MDNETNIIPFRTGGNYPNQTAIPTDTSPLTPQEVISEKIDDLRLFHISEFLDYYIPKIFNDMDIAGFSFEQFYSPEGEAEDNVHKRECFLMESIRSHLMSCVGIDHPFQKLAEGLFEVDQEEQTCQLIEVAHVEFKIKKKTEETPEQ